MDIVERLRSVAPDFRLEPNKHIEALMLDAASEIERLRALAGAVSAGAGDYRGVIDAMKEFPRLSGPDYRTIVKDVRHDLCGNE